ncbi:MAG: hypothetical protein JXB23_15675, partial [Candidatus Aminicenantes bacterium]|nr:hypothetical protein [Candidatus Aminicenantes bacterium]
MKRRITTCGLLFLFAFVSLLSAQTSPEEFLGHKVGEDRKLVDYDQILAYFKKLDEESNKIKVEEIGQTVLKKPIILAVITSEENMARLEEYRSINKKLRDAKNLTPDEAKKLARDGKVMVCFTCSQHATEIAASQMSLEFAYNLVTGKTPFDADKVLQDVIILLSPHINPDGHQMVTEWYRKYVGTKYEGGQMPYLYHHYAGHDNNRDWFMFNLPETRAVTKVLYLDWIPQIHIDEHQMGSTGARLFIPPFMNPPVPTVHPLVWRGVALCGTNMAYDLQKNGYSGVVYDRSFTGWWIGACDDTSWLHNSIGLLSEMASVNVASPIFVDPTELPTSYTEKRMQFPDPWPGGWWRLRDIVDYELVLSMSLVKTAQLHKDDFLFNFYKMCKESIENQPEGQPFAFVIPKIQRDYATMLRMLEILKLGGIEILRAEKDFIADGKTYPAGSFIVPMGQPYRAYAQALLEKQKYPDLRQYPGGPPVPPYDNAGWTLPLQMGVSCDQIDRPFKVEMAELEEIPYPGTSQPKEMTPYIALCPKTNASYAVAFALLKENAEIYRTEKPYHGENVHVCIGGFIIKNTPQVQKALPALLEKWHLQVQALDSKPDIPMSSLKNPRIGLYQSWRSNMDEGWTRYVFDDMEIPFITLHNKDFKGTEKKKVDLSAKCDVIVFADEDPDMIKLGKPGPNHPYAQYFRGLIIPPEYDGGIGKEGVEALKAFVEKGGILVTMNNACGLVIKEFDAPVANGLEKVDRSKFFCPTSLLKLKVDPTSPVGYGMPPEAAGIFSRSLGLTTWIPSGEWDRTVVASYPKEDILMSGWLLGEEYIARKAAVVDLKYKEGRIILIGFKCQHRAQSHGTYKFLLNS